MYNAFHDHKYETLEHVSTFADGIAVKTPGENTYELISKYVDDIVTVSEDEIATAILTLIEKQKLIAEGAGATPVAAALFNFTTPSTIFNDLALARTSSLEMVQIPVPFFTT